MTEKVDLQNDYDTAALNGEYASTVYDNNVTTLEEAVTEAKKMLEELQKEQEEILALEDGVIRAAQDGTIATVTYEVGNILNTDALVTYCDTSVLTISVEVSQEDIAKIAVGDTVAVLEANCVNTELPESLIAEKQDNRILKVCKAHKDAGETIILVTKDLVLRIKINWFWWMMMIFQKELLQESKDEKVISIQQKKSFFIISLQNS